MLLVCVDVPNDLPTCMFVLQTEDDAEDEPSAGNDDQEPSDKYVIINE
jgi:hypothetical protein